MSERELRQMLDQIYDLQAALDDYRLQEEEATRSLLGDELYRQLQELREEFESTRQALQETMDSLVRDVKSGVKGLGHSVKGEHLHAVYMRRTTWDTKALNGYAVAHPEVEQFRKMSPSVSIRARRDGR